MQGIDADRYITTHLYGEARREDDLGNTIINESIHLADVMDRSTQMKSFMDASLIGAKRKIDTQTSQLTKMSAFQTYIAVIKGYCGACVLFTPRAFTNGGYAFSCLTLIASGMLTTLCAVKLINVGQRLDCFCYSQIVKKSLGQRGAYLLDIMIVLSQFSFSISQLSFCV